MKYTDEQLRDFARRVIAADTVDPDFIGVGGCQPPAARASAIQRLPTAWVT